MKTNEQLNNMFCDYDYVVAALENKSNRYIHIPALQNLVFNFGRKWNQMKATKYRNDLHNRWLALDSRLFDEKIARLENTKTESNEQNTKKRSRK